MATTKMFPHQLQAVEDMIHMEQRMNCSDSRDDVDADTAERPLCRNSAPSRVLKNDRVAWTDTSAPLWDDLSHTSAIFAHRPRSGKKRAMLAFVLSQPPISSTLQGNDQDIRSVLTTLIVVPDADTVDAWRAEMRSLDDTVVSNPTVIQFRASLNAKSLTPLLLASPRVLVTTRSGFECIARTTEARFCRFERLVFSDADSCHMRRLFGPRGSLSSLVGSRFTWFVAGVPSVMRDAYDWVERYGLMSPERMSERMVTNDGGDANIAATMGLAPVVRRSIVHATTDRVENENENDGVIGRRELMDSLGEAMRSGDRIVVYMSPEVTKARGQIGLLMAAVEAVGGVKHIGFNVSGRIKYPGPERYAFDDLHGYFYYEQRWRTNLIQPTRQGHPWDMQTVPLLRRVTHVITLSLRGISEGEDRQLLDRVRGDELKYRGPGLTVVDIHLQDR